MGSASESHAFGAIAFFIQYLKMGHLFEPWVDECPLAYTSNNAPKKVNILGSLLLSILSGHTRYGGVPCQNRTRVRGCGYVFAGA